LRVSKNAPFSVWPFKCNWTAAPDTVGGAC